MKKITLGLIVALMTIIAFGGHPNHHNTPPKFSFGNRYINTPGPSGKYPGDGGGFWGRGPYYHSYGHGPGAHGYRRGVVVVAPPPPCVTVVDHRLPAITVDNYATYSYTRLPASKPIKVQKTIWVPGTYTTQYTSSGQPVQVWVEGHYDTVWTTEWLP